LLTLVAIFLIYFCSRSPTSLIMAKKKAIDQNINQEKLSKKAYSIFDFTKSERPFLIIICVLISIAGLITEYTYAAMWFGFALAAYSAIANDSIQTIGTFIISNQARKWYWLWLFIGVIWVGTVSYSWFVYNGDVSFQLLSTPGLEKAPENFVFLQLAAPIVLLIMTRMRWPVSTTFLLLNVFTYKAGTIVSVMTKSFLGYIFAFALAMVVWFALERFVRNYLKGKPKPYWMFLQWFTSGSLWAVWIMQDAANIAVFLPRTLNPIEFVAYAGFVFLGLGMLFYLKGDKIQDIINEKTNVADVRAATLVDLVYAVILFYFKMYNNVPMSTTWVFIGLLAGRELAIALGKHGKAKKRSAWLVRAFRLARKDMFKALAGLVVSIILAIVVNKGVRDELLSLF
jgi:phosphate/sulfate permease